MAAGVYKSSTNTGVGKVISQLTGTGTLTVLTQVIPPASYQAWALTQGFTAGTNDGSMLDPDGDGISNLMEYVLNGVPIRPINAEGTARITNGKVMLQGDSWGLAA